VRLYPSARDTMDVSTIYKGSTSPSSPLKVIKAPIESRTTHSDLTFPLVTSVFPLPTSYEGQHKPPQRTWKEEPSTNAYHVVDIYRADIVHPIFENIASDTAFLGRGSFWIDVGVPGDSIYNEPLWSKMDSHWQVFPQHELDPKTPGQIRNELWCVIIVSPWLIFGLIYHEQFA
jgi:hypothetical protein